MIHLFLCSNALGPSSSIKIDQLDWLSFSPGTEGIDSNQLGDYDCSFSLDSFMTDLCQVLFKKYESSLSSNSFSYFS